MIIDFTFNNTRYALCFNKFDEEIYDVEEVIELRVYSTLQPYSLYRSSIKEIKDQKIVWRKWDDNFMSKEAQEYCNPMLAMRAFI